MRYDVVIIGGGIAGIETGRNLAKNNKKVGIVEKDKLGGTALRNGALPIKRILDAFKNVKDRGAIKKELIGNWNSDIKRLEEMIESKLSGLGIDFYYSDGEFLNKNEYMIDGKILYSKKFIIATGTNPDSPFKLDIDEKRVISHRSTIELLDIPKSILILGGNVEGVELAFVYLLLGSDVVLIEKEESILHEYDKDLSDPIKEKIMKLGGRIIVGKKVKDIACSGDEMKVILENEKEINGEKILLALKRKPNIPRGLEKLNINTNNGFLEVDKNFKTAEDNIYAIGDINGIMGLANIAWHQGKVVSELIMKNKMNQLDYSKFPSAIFTIPEVAGVGYQENKCLEMGIEHRVGKAYLKDSYRGWSKGYTEGFIKVIVNNKDELIGIWMMGDNVSDYIGYFSYFIEEKIKVDKILSTLIVNPSIYDGFRDAIYNIR